MTSKTRRSRRWSSAAAMVVMVALPGSLAANAPAGRYTFPSAGVVYDTKTKLTWQQAGDAVASSLADAKTYCKNLGTSGAGWRLPTKLELASLVDFRGTGQLKIDATAFPATQTFIYGTTTALPAPLQPGAWGVGFTDGMPRGIVPNTGLFGVRCVR